MVPYVYIEAGRFLLACVGCGALVGAAVVVLHAVRRG